MVIRFQYILYINSSHSADSVLMLHFIALTMQSTTQLGIH